MDSLKQLDLYGQRGFCVVGVMGCGMCTLSYYLFYHRSYINLPQFYHISFHILFCTGVYVEITLYFIINSSLAQLMSYQVYQFISLLHVSTLLCLLALIASMS